MKEIKNDDLPRCPIETTLMFLSDRNGFLILGYAIRGVSNIDSLVKASGMTEENLKITVSTLEEKGLVFLKENNIFPTKFGRSFEIIIDAMAHWGEIYKAGDCS